MHFYFVDFEKNLVNNLFIDWRGEKFIDKIMLATKDYLLLDIQKIDKAIFKYWKQYTLSIHKHHLYKYRETHARMGLIFLEKSWGFKISSMHLKIFQ